MIQLVFRKSGQINLHGCSPTCTKQPNILKIEVHILAWIMSSHLVSVPILARNMPSPRWEGHYHQYTLCFVLDGVLKTYTHAHHDVKAAKTCAGWKAKWNDEIWGGYSNQMSDLDKQTHAKFDQFTKALFRNQESK